MRHFKKTVAALAVSAAALAPMQAHAVCPPYAETITMAATAAAKLAMEQLVNQLMSSFTDQLDIFARFKIAALKVVSTQVSTAAKAKIKAQQSVAEAELSAMALLESTKAQMKVFQDYSPQTGQGINPCFQLESQKAALAATDFVASKSAELRKAVEAAAGRFGDQQAYAAKLLATRFSMFTSPDEEKLGYGKAAGEAVTTSGERISLAGADTNAGILFVESTDPRVEAAKRQYLSYLAGSPDSAITKEMASSGSGSQYLDTKNRKDAAMSVGLHAVSNVAAEYSVNEEAGGLSRMSAMSNVVGMYFGETAKEMWRGWTAQSERGLQVDALKMASATLAMEVDQLAQSQRIETLLGTWLALEAQGIKPEVDAKARALIDATLKSPVR